MAALLEFAAQHIFPVAAPLDLVEQFSRQKGTRARRGLGLKLGRGLKPFVLKRVRLVKIVDLGQVRIGKDLRKNAPLCALPWNDLAVLASDPTALPAVLVLPVFGITYAGLGLEIGRASCRESVWPSV